MRTPSGSSAARNDRHPGGLGASLERPVEVARIDCPPERCRHHQPGLMPGRRRRPESGLNRFAVLERSHTQLGQRERGVRSRRLGLSPDERTLDPLNLPADVSRLRRQVHFCPAQAENLAPPQAKHKHQHERGVERIVTGPGVLEKTPRLVDRPHRPLPSPCTGTRTSAATLRLTSSSRTAALNALCSTVQAW